MGAATNQASRIIEVKNKAAQAEIKVARISSRKERQKMSSPSLQKSNAFNAVAITMSQSVPKCQKSERSGNWVTGSAGRRPIRTEVRVRSDNQQANSKDQNSNKSQNKRNPGGAKRALGTVIGGEKEFESVTDAKDQNSAPGVKKAKKQEKDAEPDLEFGRPGSPSDFAEGLADGLAELAGLPCYYVCDGGCDRATISDVFAQELIAKGHKMSKYTPPRIVILANGDRVSGIIGYLVADVMVKTSQGRRSITA